MTITISGITIFLELHQVALSKVNGRLMVRRAEGPGRLSASKVVRVPPNKAFKPLAKLARTSGAPWHVAHAFGMLAQPPLYTSRRLIGRYLSKGICDTSIRL